MTREKAKAFINALLKMRESASDEQAAAAPAVYPQWKDGTTYAAGARVLYDDVLYKVLQEHTAQADWTPAAAASLFAVVLIPDDTQIYEWQQPESTNPYMQGDKVTYNGSVYVSTINNNVWKPDVYGWEKVDV